jgi:hypothetical protein
MATFEITQSIKRTASVSADSISDALTLAKQKFEKPFGYAEDITYMIRQFMPMPDMAAETPQREREIRKLDR